MWQPEFLWFFTLLHHQWSGQKSGGDSAVSSEFLIAGLIFHPSRGKSDVLHTYIEPSCVAWTLLPAGHREDLGGLALLPTQVCGAHQLERCA
jgi:hypothetical protein